MSLPKRVQLVEKYAMQILAGCAGVILIVSILFVPSSATGLHEGVEPMLRDLALWLKILGLLVAVSLMAVWRALRALHRENSSSADGS